MSYHHLDNNQLASCILALCMFLCKWLNSIHMHVMVLVDGSGGSNMILMMTDNCTDDVDVINHT